MLERFFPKEKDFFPIFEDISKSLFLAVSELLDKINDPEKLPQAVARIREIENQAEKVGRDSISQLYETFITPFDRSHIYQFVVRLGELVALTRLVAEKLEAYDIKPVPAETQEIALKCGEACKTIKEMVAGLETFKKPAETLILCMSIYRIRAETDRICFKASENSYSNEQDFKALLKLREVNEDLSRIVKKCERISFLIEEIILEYA